MASQKARCVMITVDLSIDQYGVSENFYGLARIAIWNDASGTPTKGNYKYAISHQFNSPMGERAAERTGTEIPEFIHLYGASPWVWKSGYVTGFIRQRGAVKLLAAVLKDAFP